jgi:hypothetical protein
MDNAQPQYILDLSIKKLLRRWIKPGMVAIDPFARNSHWGTITNDQNLNTGAQFHIDAREFLVKLTGQGVRADAILLDLPSSPTQMALFWQQFLARC